MKVIYSSPHLFMVQHLKNILEAHGIECHIKNEHLSGAAGELPPTECWPQLCVGEREAVHAESIIANVQQDKASLNKPWTCPACGERIEPQFEWCWNCGGEFRDAEINITPSK